MRIARAERSVAAVIADKFPDIQQLSAADKLSLVGELWEELEGLKDGLPVTEEQKRTLDERFERHSDEVEPGSSWAEVKERLLNRAD